MTNAKKNGGRSRDPARTEVPFEEAPAMKRRCLSCRRENTSSGVYCRGVYCADAVPATPVLRAKLARFASRLERAQEQVAFVLGNLDEALSVVRNEKFAGLGQLELDASVAYDIAHAVQRLIEHAEAETEDMRVAARRKL